MSWTKCTEAMPPAGSKVRLKWADGNTEWNGDPVSELQTVRVKHYDTLLWWRESPSADASVLIKGLEMIIAMNRQQGEDQYGDPEKAESWGCVKVAREALAQYSTQSPATDQLIWKEGKTLIFDTTVLFSKPYNFEGLELMAQETLTPIGRVVIWPDKLGQGKKWAFYFEYDGWLKQDFDSEEAVKNAVSEAVKKEIAHQSLPESQGSKEGEGWISVEDWPLFTKSPEDFWTLTEAGQGEFLAAVPFNDQTRPKETNLWWIKHCVIDDGGLKVVGGDDNEPAGWSLEDVTHYFPIPKPPKIKQP